MLHSLQEKVDRLRPIQRKTGNFLNECKEQKNTEWGAKGAEMPVELKKKLNQ